MGAEPSRLRLRALAPVFACAVCFGAAPASAQARPDSAAARPDTLLVVDTIPAADTIPVDSVPPRDLPRLPAGPPIGWGTETWSWDRDDFMGARDLTLLELLEEIPGVVPVRGGDYGAPEGVSAFGFGGGRVRVFWDGFEMPAMDGGIPDLAMVGLGGIEELRVERGPGELRIHIESLRARDPRPFSLVEAGTGDTDTNFFQGTFMHPRVLGGIFGFTLERVDTRGPFRAEPGHRAGAWASWTRPIGESFGVRAEGRRISRDVNLNAFPVGFERTDYVFRARGTLLGERVAAELFTGGSLLESDDERVVPIERSRRQHGVRVAVAPGAFWVNGAFRLHDGEEDEELLARSLEIEGGATLPRIGGVFGRWGPDVWQERSAYALTLHGWTAPYRGISALASYAEGVRGAAVYPRYDSLPGPDDLPGPGPDEEEETPEPSPPGERFSNMSTLRLGASFTWRPLTVHGAWIRMWADSFPPFGTVLDRPGPTLPGDTFYGGEGQLQLALPIEGFSLKGSFQAWDQETRYLPKRMYQASIDFHDVFLETRNLEVWGALGVKGRDPMLVPNFRIPEGQPPELARVPFYQNWYVDVQVRVLPVHIFIRWENFVLRENLEDLPNRRLPVTRAIYGVKWVLWN